MTDEAKRDREKMELRLEKARKELFDTLDASRGETLTPKEADVRCAKAVAQVISATPQEPSLQMINRRCGQSGTLFMTALSM